MDKVYRFSEDCPQTGTIVYAFRYLSALKEFAKMQGNKGSQKFWEVTGKIVADDNSVDGIQIKVSSANEVY